MSAGMTGVATAAVALWVMAFGAAADDSDYVKNSALAAQLGTGQGPVVIDVRTPDEYARGHVPGALLMPIQTFPTEMKRLSVDKSHPIVVYCELGPRAGLAKAALRLAGYTQVLYLEGHMRAWRESGLTIQK